MSDSPNIYIQLDIKLKRVTYMVFRSGFKTRVIWISKMISIKNYNRTNVTAFKHIQNEVNAFDGVSSKHQMYTEFMISCIFCSTNLHLESKHGLS